MSASDAPDLPTPVAPSTPDLMSEIEAVIAKVERGMGAHKPTIANDITISGGLASMSVHIGTAPWPAYEQHFPAYNPADFWMGKRKLSGQAAKKTLHRKKPIVLQGHDLSLIPHAVFAVLPPEQLALLAKCTFTASRKCAFGAAKINIDKTGPLGSCTLLNWPPTPLVFCADPVSLPLGCAPTSHLNSVRFHMSALDYTMGWVEIGVDMVLSAILHELGDELEPVSESVSELVLDNATDNAKGLAISAVQSAVLAAWDTEDASHEPRSRSVEWSLAVGGFGLEAYSISVEVEKEQNGDWAVGSPTLGGLEVEGSDTRDAKQEHRRDVTWTPLGPVPDLRTWGEVL